MAQHPIVDTLNQLTGGRISSGHHSENSGKACILDCISKARGVAWTDSPRVLDMPDIRPLNDAYKSDDTRSIDMVRLGVALWDYPSWPVSRRVAFVKALADQTVKWFGSGIAFTERGDALLSKVVDGWIQIIEQTA